MSTIEHRFESERPLLMGLAYRMLGSRHAAEDIVQEAYLRWSKQHEVVANPRAWLSTVVTRLALDHCKSAEEQRKQYIGSWLPDPLCDSHTDPQHLLELDQSITMALLALLEQLTPGERAAFILHELFDFSFQDIAVMLDKPEATCRKLASRSRNRIRQQPVASSVKSNEHSAMVTAFFSAIREANTSELVTLLSEDIVFKADGGGKATAVRRILRGRSDVVDWIQRVMLPHYSDPGVMLSYRIQRFNGAPGLLIFEAHKLVTAFSFVVDESGIRQIDALRNPDKLQWLV